MSSLPLREKAIAACLAAGGLFVVVWFGLRGASVADWNVEARPAVDALVAGHGLRFLQLAPAYGGSLILRFPFMLVTKLWDGGNAAVYAASVAPCLAATAALGMWLSAQMRRRGASPLACAVVILLCTANPLAVPALQLGHPEELLGAVLCIAAVLCAMNDRPTWAAVLLGLAIPNKEWAVLAVGPVLVALQHGRVRALVITGAVATILLAPFMLAPFLTSASGGAAVSSASIAANGLNSGAIFQPWQIWWFLGDYMHLGYRTPPGWIESLGHPLIVAIMLPLTGLFAGLRRRPSYRVPVAPLLLLALLLALRCVLDPWDTAYYSLPFLLALVAWESLSFDRPPVLAVTASFAAWLVFRETGWGALNLPLDTQALAFAVVSIPSVIGLAMALYAPGLLPVLTRRSWHATAVAAAAQPGA